MFFVSKYGHIINAQVKDMGIFRDENAMKKSLEDEMNSRRHEQYWTATIDILAKTGESWSFTFFNDDIGWIHTVKDNFGRELIVLRVIM